MKSVILRKSAAIDWAFIFLLGLLLASKALDTTIHTAVEPITHWSPQAFMEQKSMIYQPASDLIIHGLSQIGSNLLIHGVTALLFSLSAILFGRILRRLGFSHFLSCLGAILFIVHPLQIHFWRDLSSFPHLMCLFLMLCAWVWLIEQRIPSQITLMMSTFCGLLACLSSSLSILYVPLSLLLLISVKPSKVVIKLIALVLPMAISVWILFFLAPNMDFLPSLDRISDKVLSWSVFLQSFVLPTSIVMNHPQSFFPMGDAPVWILHVVLLLSVLGLMLASLNSSLTGVLCLLALLLTWAFDLFFNDETRFLSPAIATPLGIIFLLECIDQLPYLLNAKRALAISGSAALLIAAWIYT